MEYTARVTGEANLRQLISLGASKPGDEITINGCRWKVLDVQDGRVLIWKFTGVEDHVFNNSGSNVYEGSDIQKFLQAGFREDLPEELLELVSEEGFFLLTIEQIRKYLPNEIDRIAADPDGDTTWWWTASPYVGHGYHVRYIITSGGVGNLTAISSIGVAPACWLTI